MNLKKVFHSVLYLLFPSNLDGTDVLFLQGDSNSLGLADKWQQQWSKMQVQDPPTNGPILKDHYTKTSLVHL